MVLHRHRLAILVLGTADILFEFLETGLDFPLGAVTLDDLGNRQGKVGGEQGNPLSTTIDLHHPNCYMGR